MTLRERLMAAGLTAALLALLTLFLWQQARYTDAEEAIRRFVRIDQQSEPRGASGGAASGTTNAPGTNAPAGNSAGAGQPATSETDPDDEARQALIRQARPELRRSLAAGAFREALRRLDALDAENASGPDPDTAGKALSIETLWPPKSPEREKARGVLARLVERLKQGYDVTDAQDALVKVAARARAGKRDEALAAFAEVEGKVNGAKLRPGFKPAAQEKDAGAPGEQVPPVNAGQVQQVVQFFRLVLPQLMQQAPPEMQPILKRLEPLGSAFEQASAAGKDLGPALRVARQLGAALQQQDTARAQRLVDRFEREISQARPLPGQPSSAANGGADPAGNARPNGTPPVGSPPGRPSLPKLPAAGGGGPTVDRLLQAMDGIRRMPPETYQQQRVGLATLIAQALGQGGGPGGGPGGGVGARPRALRAGEAQGVQVAVGPAGELLALSVGGQPLSEGLRPGGLALGTGPGTEQPLRGVPQAVAAGIYWNIVGPQGTLGTTLRRVPGGVAMVLRTKRTRAGEATALRVRLPLRAAGWRWGAEESAPVVAIDQQYSREAAEGKLPTVILSGFGSRLTVEAPAARRAALDPASGTLTIEFPLAGAPGEQQFTLILTSQK